ncbi:MAG: GTPase Era [Legionellales bacterium]|nr:GTPase Era [Legionellales bacterium]
MTNKTYCGFAAIIGRPNVGKSTLLNQILGKKLCITSSKPQTTRHQILGVKTLNEKQTVYVDTPGLHIKEPKAINRYMNRTVMHAIQDVDVIVFVVDCREWTEEDELVLQKLKQVSVPVILAVNKVDLVKDKATLLPIIEDLSKKMSFKAIIPLAAIKGNNIHGLEKEVANFLPECIHYFPDDEYTDKSIRFLVSEIIREKLMRELGSEVPYATSVVVEQYVDEKKITKISALIYVERDGQKAIVIGKKGEKLKKIGQLARLDIESLLDKKVFLQLWVKVKTGWSDSDKWLKNLGYTE